VNLTLWFGPTPCSAGACLRDQELELLIEYVLADAIGQDITSVGYPHAGIALHRSRLARREEIDATL